MGSEGIMVIWLLSWIMGAIYWHTEGPFNIHPLNPILLPFSFFFYPVLGIIGGMEAWVEEGGQQQRGGGQAGNQAERRNTRSVSTARDPPRDHELDLDPGSLTDDYERQQRGRR